MSDYGGVGEKDEDEEENGNERRLRVAEFLGDIRGKICFLSHKLL